MQRNAIRPNKRKSKMQHSWQHQDCAAVELPMSMEKLRKKCTGRLLKCSWLAFTRPWHTMAIHSCSIAQTSRIVPGQAQKPFRHWYDSEFSFYSQLAKGRGIHVMFMNVPISTFILYYYHILSILRHVRCVNGTMICHSLKRDTVRVCKIMSL